MSMYALQVMTGMEAEITQKLRGKGVDARCPQERRMIRRGGKWQEQLYTLFPSYIFVSTPDVYRVYYAVRDEDGVLHWLIIPYQELLGNYDRWTVTSTRFLCARKR